MTPTTNPSHPGKDRGLLIDCHVALEENIREIVMINSAMFQDKYCRRAPWITIDKKFTTVYVELPVRGESLPGNALSFPIYFFFPSVLSLEISSFSFSISFEQK